jgi:zinc transport system substrate-binding protein
VHPLTRQDTRRYLLHVLRTRTILILGITAALAVGSGVLSACTPGHASLDGRLRVVTSFYPLEAAATAVGGRSVTVEDLTPPGVEPHDLELTSDQIDSVLDADVVLYLGGGFQPAVEDAVRQRPPDRLSVDVLAALGSAVHAPGVGVAEGNETADPHVWLDPVLMKRVVGIVAETLDRADAAGGASGGPGNAAGYARAAGAFDRQLDRLDAAYRAGLAHCRSRLIVTTHAAFGYLAARYGLRQEPLTGLSPEGEPDPAHLAAAEDLIRREHVSTVFTEPLASSGVAETVARETGARVAVLDPIESLTATERARGDTYFTIMRRNLEALRGALGCTG